MTPTCSIMERERALSDSEAALDKARAGEGVKSLHISGDLALPLDAVTQTFLVGFAKAFAPPSPELKPGHYPRIDRGTKIPPVC